MTLYRYCLLVKLALILVDLLANFGDCLALV